MHRLPLRFLTAASVAGLSLLAAPAAPAQITSGAAEQSDAPEPRFGMFRDPAGYEGSDPDPVDYNGELLSMGDGELTLSLWKGINGAEALEEATGGAYGNVPGRPDHDAANPAAAGDGAVGDGAPEPSRMKVGDDTTVFINGRRAKLSDLRPGDRIRARGVDPDGSSIEQIVALRSGDIRVGGGITPNVGSTDGLASTGAEASTDAPTPEIARAAETGITTPGGGGFQDAPRITPTGDTKQALEDPNRGVSIDPAAAGDAGESPQSPGAPGFGFAVADSPGEGVLVADVQPGGPADSAGVRRGDFLTRLNEQSVETPEDVRSAAREALSGEQPKSVPATLWRDGEEQNVELTPSKDALDHFERSAGRALGVGNEAGVAPRLGAQVRDSDETGVEVLAGVAVGALAAEAADEESRRGGLPVPRTTGYRGGYYAAPITPARAYGGLDIYDFAYAGPAVRRGLTLEEQAAIQARAAAAARQAAAKDALGVDAEDYFPGQLPEELEPANRNPRDNGDRLLPYDRIIGVNNRPVHDRAELNRALRNHSGDMLTLNVLRNGSSMSLRLPKRVAEEAAD